MRKLLTYGGSFMVLANCQPHCGQHCASEKYALTVKHAVNPAAQRTANRHAKKLAGWSKRPSPYLCNLLAILY